jgi:peptidoglycan/xylan/chitin deacetylase (PgdA/CDA1 family)
MPELLWGPGFRGAVSLTFDDGLPCQLVNAVPELDDRNMKATFFLIVNDNNCAFMLPSWKKVRENGHEIGSHSMNHLKAATLTVEVADFECRVSKNILSKHFDNMVSSFCYPYTDAIPVIQNAVRDAGYTQARGGRVARKDKFIPFHDDVNLMNVPCFHLGPNTIAELPMWIKEAEGRRAWFTLMIHGVGEPGTWDNIDREQFAQVLDTLKGADLWIERFGVVADFFRRVGRQ